MKVLWFCNVVLPMIGRQVNIEGSNKEGWISGLLEEILKRREENGIEIYIAFPTPKYNLLKGCEVCVKKIYTGSGSFDCYGFEEIMNSGGYFDTGLGKRMEKILEEVQPDIIHCFGTEFAHSLEAVKNFKRPGRTLVGLQGLCMECADAYYANLPEDIISKQTMRDKLKEDSIEKQRTDFAVRGAMEVNTLAMTGHVTGRTEWDRQYAMKYCTEGTYHKMNEILRPEFYGPVWEPEKCTPHSIFVSQGDYPLKGLHYMLLALPDILEKYPDTKLYVAGNSLVRYETLKDWLKITEYGRYLRKLMKRHKIEDKVVFTGRLDAEQMCRRHLKSNLFVCCSTVENSPNSLGEAMLLGVPCVTARVGGISSVFDDGKDGIMYEGFQPSDNITRHENAERLKKVSKALAGAVIEMWSDKDKMMEYCKNARNHALKTHDREKNYQKLLEIYAEMMASEE